MNHFIDWKRNAPFEVAARRGRVRGLTRRRRRLASVTSTETPREAAAATTRLVLLCSFQKEESVIVDELRARRAATRAS